MQRNKLKKKNNELLALTVFFFFVWSCQFRSQEWNAVLLTEMALMSLVCPLKVCLQAPSLRSHSLARESQAPEMKVFMSGDRARDMQSPMWLVKITFCLPVSRSHRQLANRGKKSVNPGCEKKINHPYIDTYAAVFTEGTHQVVSPEAVIISESLMKRQHDRYPVCSLRKISWISTFIYRNGWTKKFWVSYSPVCASSSLSVLGLAALILYTVQMLSKPPLATRLPEGAKATLITQADFNGTATSCEQESFL